MHILNEFQHLELFSFLCKKVMHLVIWTFFTVVQVQIEIKIYFIYFFNSLNFFFQLR